MENVAMIPVILTITAAKIYVFGWLPVAFIFNLPFWF